MAARVYAQLVESRIDDDYNIEAKFESDTLPDGATFVFHKDYAYQLSCGNYEIVFKRVGEVDE